MKDSMINFGHSVRDDVLGQIRGVRRLRIMLRVRRASRSRTGGRRDFFFLFFASASLSKAFAASACASRSSMSSEDDPSNE